MWEVEGRSKARDAEGCGVPENKKFKKSFQTGPSEALEYP